MYIKRIEGPRAVTLPDSTKMTRADLPPVDTVRWVARRKAAVVKAIAAGLISQDEALARYSLSLEELDGWRLAISRHGTEALRTTKVQRYRQP